MQGRAVARAARHRQRDQIERRVARALRYGGTRDRALGVDLHLDQGNAARSVGASGVGDIRLGRQCRNGRGDIGFLTAGPAGVAAAAGSGVGVDARGEMPPAPLAGAGAPCVCAGAGRADGRGCGTGVTLGFGGGVAMWIIASLRCSMVTTSTSFCRLARRPCASSAKIKWISSETATARKSSRWDRRPSFMKPVAAGYESGWKSARKI